MRHIIVGTAGHVDHGKTALVKALTGIDTDRLKEEKKRGITIETGFAHLDFDKRRVGIVDVPGHEKFIKNMLAGAGGIDVAMFVVAADEGVMPQTEEHLYILQTLGITNGIIVITKLDTVDKEFCELVMEEVRESVTGTFLESAPMLAVSAHTGEGISELKEALFKIIKKIEGRRTEGAFRLPIDRVFSKTGFGTVVTGTLVEGEIAEGDEAVLYPSLLPIKLKNLQAYSESASNVYAGQRVAVNLSGTKKSDVNKGDVIAKKDSLMNTRLLDVRLETSKNTSRSIKNSSRLHFYHGARELICRVTLFGVDELEAGELCYAQLAFEDDIVAKQGDRFIVRFLSPLETVGGGLILDVHPFRHRRNRDEVIEHFIIKENGVAAERLEVAIREHSYNLVSLAELARRVRITPGNAQKYATELEKKGKIVQVREGIYLSAQYVINIQQKLLGELKLYHQNYPLAEGMPLQEARSKIDTNNAVADGMLAHFAQCRIIKQNEGRVSLFHFEVVRLEEDIALADEIALVYKNAGFAPPTDETVAQQFSSNKRFSHVFTTLIRNKVILRLDSQHYIHSEYFAEGLERARKLFEQSGQVVLGEFRDVLETTRKHALSLLEQFDQYGYTRKVGEGRIFRK